MNKKASHVGMIISFVIFITFIVFLYIVVNPAISVGESKKTTLDYIGNKIEKNVSTNFTTASIQINSSINPAGQTCVELKDFFIWSGISYNLKVKNETNVLQEAYANTANLIIVRKVGNSLFFKVYSSPEFERLENKTASSCFLMDYGRYYTLGSITTGKYVYEENIYVLMNYYQTDYERLKEEFNIAPGDEFGFGFTWNNETKIEVGNAGKGINVFAKEVPVQYLDSRANILSGFINVKVW